MPRETTCGHVPHRAKGLCQKCYSAAYYAANRVTITTSVAEWAKEHPDRRAAITRRYRRNRGDAWRAQQRSYYAANAPQIRATTAAYRDEHREQRRAVQRAAEARRRARKASAVEPDLTEVQWQRILEEFDHRCAYCNRDGHMEQEHMTPLARGGCHTANNVVPACGTCNRKKYTKTALEFVGPY